LFPVNLEHGECIEQSHRSSEVKQEKKLKYQITGRQWDENGECFSNHKDAEANRSQTKNNGRRASDYRRVRPNPKRLRIARGERTLVSPANKQ
jgi:hypothetical protein